MGKNRIWFLNKSINFVIITGEVVDTSIRYDANGNCVIRVRIKLRSRCAYSKYSYVDVFGRKNIAEIMNNVCQVGNVVYVEGEFKNAVKTKNVGIQYVLVTHIECLHRRKTVVVPDQTTIQLLDNLDPIGYINDSPPRLRKDELAKINKEE